MARIWEKPAIGSGWMHRLGAAGQRDVDLALLDQLVGPGDAPRRRPRRPTPGRARAPRDMFHSPTAAAGPFGISIGTVSTATLRRPSVSSRSSWSSRVTAPPMPVPIDRAAAQRVDLVGAAGVGPGLAGGDQRDLLAAVEPAGLDPGEHLGRLDRERRVRCSPAGRTWSTHGSSMFLTPTLPSSMACQVSGAVPPIGVVAPMPVTTTSFGTHRQHSWYAWAWSRRVGEADAVHGRAASDRARPASTHLLASM